MAVSTSQNRGWLAIGAGSNDDKTYDEERLERTAGSRWSTWPKKSLRIPRLRRVAVCLLLIDVIIVAVVIRCFEPLITLLLRNEEMFGARLTLPLNQTTAEPHPERQTISRILHQTSATYTIPDEWVPAQKSCKEAYAEYEYKHWTDELARDFISSEYPWFIDTWDNYVFPIQRADAIRYFVLYHFGGVYLDMDTLCNETLPLHQIEADGTPHHSVFKSTTPTGVSNDFMVSSAGHPVMAAAISRLLFYDKITHWWARLLPHAAIMISAGPFFVSMAIKNYLLEQPSLPSPAVHVINATELAPYITDLEGCSWHHGDTRTLMWVGDRPWVWFSLGAIGLFTGLRIINHFLLLGFKRVDKVV